MRKNSKNVTLTLKNLHTQHGQAFIYARTKNELKAAVCLPRADNITQLVCCVKEVITITKICNITQ